MKAKDKYELPFDQFSRQLSALSVINALRGKGDKFKILDVGGYKGVTAQLHNQDQVTVLDVFDVSEESYVKGDARKMEFSDNSFDFVVSFDVFEHIPGDDRKQVIAECNRVAKRGVVIAAPVRTLANEYAENSLNHVHNKLHGADHRWLKEHIDYGLPGVDEAKKLLESFGVSTLTLGSNEINAWMQMQGAIFVATKYSEALGPLRKLNEYYNRNLNPDNAKNLINNYRHIVIGLKSKRDTDKLSVYIGNKNSSIKDKFNVEATLNIINYYVDVITLTAEKQKTTASNMQKLDRENKELKKRLERIEKSILLRLARKIKRLVRRKPVVKD